MVQLLFLKLLIWCTPNGSVCYFSSVYLGSISDPTLTKECGFVDKMKWVKGTSIMAYRGFTICDSLCPLQVGLNLPRFIEERGQLPAADV